MRGLTELIIALLELLEAEARALRSGSFRLGLSLALLGTAGTLMLVGVALILAGTLPLSGHLFEPAHGHPDHRHGDPAHVGRIGMERQATQPLNPEDAKARLRAAATGGQALSWVRSYPKEGVLAAFILGVIIGDIFYRQQRLSKRAGGPAQALSPVDQARDQRCQRHIRKRIYDRKSRLDPQRTFPNFCTYRRRG